MKKKCFRVDQILEKKKGARLAWALLASRARFVEGKKKKKKARA
jgi:hypothetical protein